MSYQVRHAGGMQTTSYPSDLTDAQWARLEPMLRPARKTLGRPPAEARTMVHAIFYVTRRGIPWRFLPKEYGPWQTAYGTFRRGQAGPT